VNWPGYRAGMKVIPLCLGPGTDLKRELQRTVNREGLTAAWVMTCVGSLRQVTLRLGEIRTVEGEFEIISAAGTLAVNGLHIHLAVADPQGTLLGGHLMTGCIVAEEGTVEVVLGADDGWRFGRGRDPRTGFDELTISRA
jgi:predicted DNA-binding protein with PD1-like motif